MKQQEQIATPTARMQTRLVTKMPHMRKSDYPQCSSECLVIYKYAQ